MNVTIQTKELEKLIKAAIKVIGAPPKWGQPLPRHNVLIRTDAAKSQLAIYALSTRMEQVSFTTDMITGDTDEAYCDPRDLLRIVQIIGVQGSDYTTICQLPTGDLVAYGNDLHHSVTQGDSWNVSEFTSSGSITLERETWDTLIRSIVPATQKDDSRKAFKSVCLDMEHNSYIRAVATDGYRLHLWDSMPIRPQSDEYIKEIINRRFLVPADALRLFNRLLPKRGGDIWIEFNNERSLCRISDNRIVVLTSLESGKYLDWEQVIPPTSKADLLCMNPDTLRVMQRCAALMPRTEAAKKERDYYMKIGLYLGDELNPPGRVVLHNRKSIVANFEDGFTMQHATSYTDDQPIELHIDPAYLSDAIKNAVSDDADMTWYVWSDEHKGMLAMVDREGIYYLIMLRANHV